MAGAARLDVGVVIFMVSHDVVGLLLDIEVSEVGTQDNLIAVGHVTESDLVEVRPRVMVAHHVAIVQMTMKSIHVVTDDGTDDRQARKSGRRQLHG